MLVSHETTYRSLFIQRQGVTGGKAIENGSGMPPAHELIYSI